MVAETSLTGLTRKDQRWYTPQGEGQMKVMEEVFGETAIQREEIILDLVPTLI